METIQGMHAAVEFSVRRWSAWAPGLTEAGEWREWAAGRRAPGSEPDRPDVAFLPAMLRRRTSRVTRAALWAAYRCAGDEHHWRTVFASRHGELHRSSGLLQQLAAGEPLSPNAFSLSVHNTAAGLYSIASGNQAASTALAAGRDTLPCAVTEAAGYLERGDQAVIVVMADEQPPEFYRRWIDLAVPAYAIALMLTPPIEGQRWQLAPDPDAPDAEPSSPPELALVHMLAGDRANVRQAGERCGWLWARGQA